MTNWPFFGESKLVVAPHPRVLTSHSSPRTRSPYGTPRGCCCSRSDALFLHWICLLHWICFLQWLCLLRLPLGWEGPLVWARRPLNKFFNIDIFQIKWKLNYTVLKEKFEKLKKSYDLFPPRLIWSYASVSFDATFLLGTFALTGGLPYTCLSLWLTLLAT